MPARAELPDLTDVARLPAPCSLRGHPPEWAPPATRGRPREEAHVLARAVREMPPRHLSSLPTRRSSPVTQEAEGQGCGQAHGGGQAADLGGGRSGPAQGGSGGRGPSKQRRGEHSPRTAPRRTCSCPLHSTTPTVAGPSCPLPSHLPMTLSSGRRSESPLREQQEQPGLPQTRFRTMTMIRHCRLLGEREINSDLLQK